MAKRKSKSSNKALKYIKYGAILLAIVGFFMAFVNFVVCKSGDTVANSFSGFQVIFGYTEKTSLADLRYLSFSFVAMLALLLPLIGSFSVLFKNRIVRLIGAIFMVAGAVLCFLMPNFLVVADTVYGSAISTLTKTLGVGAILSGIFFALGACLNVYAVVEK